MRRRTGSAFVITRAAWRGEIQGPCRGARMGAGISRADFSRRFRNLKLRKVASPRRADSRFAAVRVSA